MYRVDVSVVYPPDVCSYSHLVVMAEEMIVVREVSDRPGWGRVKHSHKLNTVLKITAKKKHPDIITFKFGKIGDSTNLAPSLRLRIPNSSKATSAITTQIMKFMNAVR